MTVSLKVGGRGVLRAPVSEEAGSKFPFAGVPGEVEHMNVRTATCPYLLS